MKTLMQLVVVLVSFVAMVADAQTGVYFPGAVRGLYGYSYGGTAGYNEYAKNLRTPRVVSGGYRGGALPVSGGYRGGALPAGGYRGIQTVDYYDDLENAYDYYAYGGDFNGRGYRPYRGRRYPYNYHNYY